MNPLFTDEPAAKDDKNSYLLSRSDKYRVKPLSHADNSAVQMLRHKIDALYQQEPDARQESAAAERAHQHRSKHEAFMHRLTTSGRSMAEIQTAWHDYYAKLPDREKHQVWQEFYQANRGNRASATAQHAAPQELELYKPIVSTHELPRPAPSKRKPPAKTKTRRQSTAKIKKELLQHVRASSSLQEKAKQHLQSLAFGIGLGALALLIALFGLFNELVITPFIRPASASATPIILDPNGPAPSSTPQVIIPKLNAQLPATYNNQLVSEDDIQKALETGVYHYPSTAVPGQNGNLAIFGHSSNNILNKGHYKFAFVLLHELEPGDIFYLTYQGKVYTYKVFTKKVVNPNETWVLTSTEGKTATAALITCDPPGSTRHRLVVWGEQITPDPATNGAAATPSPELQTQDLPGKAPDWWAGILNRLNPFN